MAHFNRHSQVSNISPESGNETAMKNDSWEFLLTGIMDNSLTNEKRNLEDLLEDLKQEAINTNKEFAEKLGHSTICRHHMR